MEVFNNLEEIKINESTVVALGNFDGVHVGHQQLIKNAVEFAHLQGLKSAVFTFSNHPRNLGKKDAVKSIQDADEKAEFIASFGIDYLFNIPFDDSIRHLSSEDFVDKILINRFKIKQAYCGFNYRFGFRAGGNPEKLLHYGIEKGFGLHILEPFKIDGIIVSSTEIRMAIEQGNMTLANKYLGRNYVIKGEVLHGNQLGSKIGIPTANLSVPDGRVVPLYGVYVTNTYVDGEKYRSISNIGKKPTIGEYDTNLESHILDFDKVIYGKEIKVEFLEFVRSEQCFDNIELLKEAIKKDCEIARKF
ncbi:MAG: bifunctional riboflavin kinase/FAD synthetase [Eubacteriales bacterium]